MAGGKQSEKQVELSKRRAAAVDLRKQGGTFRQIADQLKKLGLAEEKYDHTAAYKDVQGELAVLNKQRSKDADILRTLELERLDAMLALEWPRMKTGDGWAAQRILSIISRRCALLGLDKPSQMQIGPLDDGEGKLEVPDSAEADKLARDFLACIAGSGAQKPSGSGIPGS
jgi:hypothetical protein